MQAYALALTMISVCVISANKLFIQTVPMFVSG